MFQILQIVFCILSVACVAAILPVGAFFDWKIALVLGFGAFLSFMAMNFCKEMHLARHPEDRITEKQPQDSQETDAQTKENQQNPRKD